MASIPPVKPESACELLVLGLWLSMADWSWPLLTWSCSSNSLFSLAVGHVTLNLALFPLKQQKGGPYMGEEKWVCRHYGAFKHIQLTLNTHCLVSSTLTSQVQLLPHVGGAERVSGTTSRHMVWAWDAGPALSAACFSLCEGCPGGSRRWQSIWEEWCCLSEH